MVRQTEYTPKQNKIVTEEQRIREVLESVVAAFSRLDIAAWLQCFNFPFQIVSSEGIIAPASIAEGQMMMEPTVERLRARGFKRSQLEKCGIKLLSNGTAIASIVLHVSIVRAMSLNNSEEHIFCKD